MNAKLMILIILAALVLAACSIPGAGAPQVGGEADDALAGTELLTNEAGGYSLRYPSIFTIEYPAEDAPMIVGPALEIGQARGFIYVEDAAGRTAEQAADELTAPFAQMTPEVEGAGLNIERSNITVSGEPAVVLDNMPGQDIMRQVLFVHDGRLFTLSFVPADENLGDAYNQMDQLYNAVINSFDFVSVE